MEQSTQAIVLHATKYGETSVILNAYTQQSGLRAYVVKGVRSAKRNKTFSMGMFQPLTQLELVAFTPKHGGLSILKSAKLLIPTTPFQPKSPNQAFVYSWQKYCDLYSKRKKKTHHYTIFYSMRLYG